MKVFVIHSGADYDEIKPMLSELSCNTVSTEILMLQNGGKFWKIEARKKIAQAQLVLFFVGKNSHKSENIAWELKKAIKYNKKLIAVRLDPANILHPALRQINSYTKEPYDVSEEMSLSGVIQTINASNGGDYSLFNGNPAERDRMSFLLEQYKVFLQTSEALVERRQSVSNFYISVNSALVALINIFVALDIQKVWKCTLSLAIPFIGIILCFSWIKLLTSYGELNASKMRIISIIEKQLPASIYDAEWRAQSDRLKARPYVSFTKQEAFIPKMFIVLYTFIFLIAMISFVFFIA